MSNYRYPVGVQIALPEDFQESKEFFNFMRVFSSEGISGLELNMEDPDRFSFPEIQSYLAEFGMGMTMFASGLTAKTRNVTLSDADASVRNRAVDMMLSVIEKLRGMDAGIIVGFLKGSVCPDPKAALSRFVGSLKEIAPGAEKAEVPILIEATNRYESSIANSLHDTAQLIDAVGSPMLRILPDTFHMNIEEVNMLQAVRTYHNYIDSIHLSDNNRFLPGHGALDFAKIIDFLDEISYQGGLALEGNTKSSLEEDLLKSMSYLAPMLLE